MVSSGSGERIPFLGVVPKTSAAQRYHEEIFLPQIEKNLQELDRLPLSVFLCGPSRGINPIVKKRTDTVNELRVRHFNAFTGEEAVDELKKRDEQARRTIRPDNIYEKEIARHSDMIIIFCISPGSVAETHEFLSFAEISLKTILFVDEEHKQGYSAGGAVAMHEGKLGKVLYYKSPVDIESCRLLTRVLEIAESYRAAKWWQTRE